MRGLSGKGVLVTGGTRGIGKAAGQRFLEEGSRVYLCGRDEGDLMRAIDELRRFGDLDGMASDVSDPVAVDHLIDAAVGYLGRIDVLVNNAGVASEIPFLELRSEEWLRVIETNLNGLYFVAQAVAKHMVSRGVNGAIVNMSSTNGLQGEPGYAHYNASKAGALLLTKTMAAELGPYGIRVNALCPGYIQTPMSAAIDSPEFVAAYVRDKIPLGRVGRPEDIAAAYAFLASDEAAFITGAALVIDGGQLAP
jgi:NAD(P)-dependent dehydrogenase (short-subunit alcohol dehydrogenase family)